MKRRRWLRSTAVVAAVRDLNRLELVGESVRALVETLSAAAPDWLAQVVDVPGWSRRYGRRVDSWKMPASKTKQDTLAIDYARDGFALIAVEHADVPRDRRGARDQLALLRVGRRGRDRVGSSGSG